MWQTIKSIQAAVRFHDYKPRPLKWLSASRWVDQFPKKDRRSAIKLLDRVIYLSENKTKTILLEQNAALMDRLAKAGLPPKKLIYVQLHDAGSSSPVMLNLLRDTANLERLGCNFVDARDIGRLNDTMNRVGMGALIYVDDFVGTGDQFCKARDFAAKNFVVTNFSEFIIAPSICEEAFYKLSERGIEAFTGHVHSKAERPLHANSSCFVTAEKKSLELACKGVNDRFGLGYNELATMVVLYRNAPNTVPAVFRGNMNQTPFFGIFPRTTDLPIPRPR